MYTLFIDTHSDIVMVGLYNGEDVIYKKCESTTGHATILAPMIDSILKENNLTFKDLKNVVAVNGPGSFTGLRIGLTHAKVISYSLGIPIYLISTLKAYLISSNLSNGVSIIEDNKGYYVLERKNGEFLTEVYVTDVTEFENLAKASHELDIKSVVEYALKESPVNAHLVRANYVKKIEAEK